MTTTTRIVPFAPRHIPDARALWDKCEGIGLSDADSPELLTRFLEANPRTCFVLLSSDGLLGTVLGGSDGRRGYIYHLAVDASMRGVGAGKALLEVCLGGLRDAGIQKAHLFVMGDNEQAQTFYEHLGWARRDDLVVFSEDLSSGVGGGGGGSGDRAAKCTC